MSGRRPPAPVVLTAGTAVNLRDQVRRRLARGWRIESVHRVPDKNACEPLWAVLSPPPPPGAPPGSAYEYATARASDVGAIFQVPREPGAYISRDATSAAVADLLARGFRWVRTDGEWAVFERLGPGPGAPGGPGEPDP